VFKPDRNLCALSLVAVSLWIQIGCGGTQTTRTTPPAITGEPADVTVTSGTAATFTVTATGSNPLTYQWRKGNTDIPGATAASYTTPLTQFEDDATTFAVTVSNGAGMLQSRAALLTVQSVPVISEQPADQEVIAGARALFSVTATGTAPFSYQWKKNGTAITGATTDSYQTPVTTTADNGSLFTVTVTNDLGNVTSEAATLKVNPAGTLNIVTQPANQRVTTGSTATFSVTATSSAAITYQWRKNGTAITGATAAQYTTPVLAATDGTTYSVTLVSGGTTVNSHAATLAIDTSIDDLITKAGGKSWSSTTPMGRHFQGLHVTTAADRTTLANATIQPPVPPGLVSSLHLKAFPVTLYPSGTPTPADINQHNIGDCNGLSAMACLVYQSPAFVKSLITDAGNGVFAVAMFDPQGLPITVKVDSQFLADASGNLVAVTGKSNKADWATVLEKAVMKYNTIFHADDNIEGIGSENETPLFTGVGNSFSFDRGALTPEQITRVIKASLACGKLITGGYGTEVVLGNIHAVTGHGYACYWPKDASTMISMRNPWGVNPTTTGGYDSSLDGLLNIPSTTTWSQTIDLRIIDSGIMGSTGRTTPYTPVAAQVVMEEIRISPRIVKPSLQLP